MSSPTSIVVKGRDTRVCVEGDVLARPILLLHGLGRSLEDWAPQHHRLAGCRTIALDIPGFGFSARPSGPISLTVLAQAVLDTLDVLGEQMPVHVMANSLGGAVALQLLALQPQRVASLVLVSSAGFGSEIHPLLRLMAMPVLGRLATRYTTRASARMIERLIFADASLATRVRIDHALQIGRQSTTGAVVHETAHLLCTGRGVRPEWRSKLITEVSNHPRPTLIMWGDRDRILPARQLEAARRLLPHAQYHLFTGIGHMPQIESADQFANLALTFIESSAQPE